RQAITADDVVAHAPDAVVVATGGHIAVPSIPGAHLPHVHTGPGLRALLDDQLFGGWRQRLVRPAAVRLASRAWMPVGRRVVIIGGDLVALGLGEVLAGRGRLGAVLEAGKGDAPG